MRRGCFALALWLCMLGAAGGEDFDASLAAARDDGRSLAPEELRVIDGAVYFAGNLSNSGIAYREPWITRGTTNSSTLLRDIRPGPSPGSDPAEFTKAGASVFFAATDGSNGRELWRTNGTPEGTVLVKNIRPGSGSSNPSALIECGGKLLFYADDGTNGGQLWISDGTEAGTSMLKRIGHEGHPAKVRNAINWNGVVYFSAEDRTNNAEVWVSNGTEGGTYLLKDIGSNSSDPASLVVFKSALYFQANSPASGFTELWRTDGTSGGTILVKAAPGTTNGFTLPTVVGDLLFFSAPEVNHEEEIWRSDGTEAGTYIVKVIDPRSGSGSAPHDLVDYDGTLYFVARDQAHGEQIWKSDGSSAGTVMVHEIYNPSGVPAPQPNSLVVFQGQLLFKQTRRSFSPMEWWQTDGTSAGLKVVLPAGSEVFSSGRSSAFGSGFAIGGSALFFAGYQSGSVASLWKLTMPLTITSQPAARLVAKGASVSFTVAASPAGGIEAQWDKDGVPIAGATALSYTIDSAQLKDAAGYRARLSSPTGGATSAEVELGVVDRAVAAAQAAEGGTLTFKTNAAGAGLTYRWMHNGTDLPADRRIEGVTTPELSIGRATSTDAGAYICEVKMGGLSLTTLPAAAAIVTPPIVTPKPPPEAIVTGAFSWQLAASQAPARYVVSGLPTGLVFDPVTGLVSGTPKVFGTFTVRVAARNRAGLGPAVTFTLTVAELPEGDVGDFGGLIARHAVLGGGLGGSLSAKVTPLGALSGQLKLGAASFPFRGGLTAPLAGNASATVVIPRNGLPPLTLDLVFNPALDSLTGTVSDGTDSAAIDARRRVWGTNPAAQFAGKYNVALDLPASLRGNLAHPQGTGWARLDIATSGRIKLTGATASGGTLNNTALNRRVMLWPDGSIPILALLDAGHGSLCGLLRITPAGGAPAYADSRVASAGLSWQKLDPANAADRTYRDGFAPIAIVADGSKWSAPPAGQNVLGVAESADNARVEFSEGGIAGAAQATNLDQTFLLSEKNVASFNPGANPCRVSLSINASTGRFTGGFTVTDLNPRGGAALQRSVLLSGVILRHRSLGWGYFLLPQLPTSASAPPVSTQPILSGKVELRAR